MPSATHTNAAPRTTVDTVPQLGTTLTWRDTLKRWSLRWGIARGTSRFEPGLYRIGEPTSSAPVLVTCNYRMTVDLVRRDLAGVDCWLLVLETYGVNVWCAAGKGTFGTDELVRRVFDSHLTDFVDHETLILPQLGAVGVAAAAVQQLTGHRVVWGPVRSADLREFLAAGSKATPEMRAVTFTLAERIALSPVEFLGSLRYAWWAVPALSVLAITAASLGARQATWAVAVIALFPATLSYLLASVAGGVVTPAVLPWLPGRAFAVKGAVAGAVLAGVGLAVLPGMYGMQSVLGFSAVLLMVTAFASYLGVNFTGSTPYTSPSGVERELRRAIPAQAIALGVGIICWTISWYLVGQTALSATAGG